MVDIAEEVRGEARQVGNGDWRVGANGALLVHADGSFHDFSANIHGYGAIELLKLLHAVDQAGALRLAQEWLKDHAGDARLGRNGGKHRDEDEADVLDAAERLAMIQAMWDRGQPIAGAPAEMYLQSRGLKPSAEDGEQLRWIAGARGFGAATEGAMVAALKDNEANLVAIQLTYIDSEGRKSAECPTRVTLRGPADWNRRAAVRFASMGTTGAAKLVICEGTEDALSARAAGADRVWAVLGVGRIGTIGLPSTVQDVVVVRDDDPPGSPADLALVRGLVRLLGRGVKVSVTARPDAIAGEGCGLKDANDLLQHDPELVRDLLAGAAKPTLSHEAAREAAIDEASRLGNDAYERAREPLAKLLDWRRPVLDGARAQRRKEREPANNASADTTAEEPWPDPVTDIRPVLFDIVYETKRYVVAPLHSIHTVALWSAQAHLLHREDLRVEIAPRLAIQSPVRGCGKTTLLEVVMCLAPRARMSGSISTAAVFRVIDAFKPTLGLDESDNLFQKGGNPDMLAVLNSGHRRSTAYVDRAVPREDGRFELARFSTFTGIAFAGIEQLPETLQDRSIVVVLKRATAAEAPEHLVNGTSAALVEARRKLARWALDLTALPEIDRPKELLNRAGDNWYAMRQIAALAAGKWPEYAMAAACSGDGDDNGLIKALLDATWRAFAESRLARMETPALLEAIRGMDDGRWNEVCFGKPITEYFFSRQLGGVLTLNSPEARSARKWRVGKDTKRGYALIHFADAWLRYLDGRLPPSSECAPEEGSKDPPQPPHPPQSTQGADISHGFAVADGDASVLTEVPYPPQESAVADYRISVADGTAKPPQEINEEKQTVTKSVGNRGRFPGGRGSQGLESVIQAGDGPGAE
jgi:putative DNA primase/helicase